MHLLQTNDGLSKSLHQMGQSLLVVGRYNHLLRDIPPDAPRRQKRGSRDYSVGHATHAMGQIFPARMHPRHAPHHATVPYV